MDVILQVIQSGWLPILVAAAVIGYYYNVNKHSYWQRQGLKGPKPLPIIGNMLDQFLGNQHKIQLGWLKEYGKVWGIYQGLTPTLFIADPELVNRICIKDFDMFTDHLLFSSATNKYQKNFLFFLKGQHWKKVRALMSPTFTSGKMRRMFKLMDSCADDLLALCEQTISENNGLINLKDTYSLYTFDAISCCCYSLKIDRKGSTSLDQVAKKSDFVKHGLSVFSFRPFRTLVGFFMPEFLIKTTNFAIVPETVMDPIVSRVNAIIEERRKSGRRVEDYLQMLLEARLGHETEVNELDDKEAHHVGHANQQSIVESEAEMVKQMAEADEKTTKSETKLTDIEVLAQASLLMLVGLETTANLLTITSYVLAFHQDIQQTLYDEVAKLAEYEDNDAKEKKRARFSYEDLTCCVYLDCVISECLRFMTPLSNFDRLANQDYFVDKYGVKVPKGNRVIFATHAIHHNPEFWPEPEKIDPLRFMPERRDKIVPGSYIPFGMGPRHCIGMRFSLTESKLALARMLMKYKFEPAPNTVFPPAIKPHFALVSPSNPVIKFVDRN